MNHQVCYKKKLERNPLQNKFYYQVNSIAWAPPEYGLIFACGSSDSSISIVSLSGDGNWTSRKIDNAHTVSTIYVKKKIKTHFSFSRPDAMQSVGHQHFHKMKIKHKVTQNDLYRVVVMIM